MKLSVKKALPVVSFAGLLVLFGFVLPALGATNLQAPEKVAATDIGTLPELFNFVKKLIGWMLVFSLLIGVVFIIIGGITYVTAGGNTERASTGAKQIGFALLGIAIMVLAFALVNVVASIVGGTTSNVINQELK